MASLFISYSRKDTLIARKLSDALKNRDMDIWIDWEGIPFTVDWWREITRGIEQADNFLFLLSPDSVKSLVCKREIKHAVKNGKRLIPIVVRDVDPKKIPGSLRGINWVYLRETDNYRKTFRKLIAAINADYEWAQTHSQLQVKALEWDRTNRENSFLLRGTELTDAELQLAKNSSKEPFSTDLQREYVFTSRQWEDKQRSNRTKITTLVAIALAALAVFGLVQARLANERARIARSGELAAESENLQITNFDLSHLLAVEALQTAETPQTRDALLSALLVEPHLEGHWEVPHVTASRFGSDDETLITHMNTGDNENLVAMWNVTNHRTIQTIPIDFPIPEIPFVTPILISPNGSILGYAGTIIDTALMMDTVSGKQLAELVDCSPYSPILFSLDSNLFICISSENHPILWDTSSLHKSEKLFATEISEIDIPFLTPLALSQDNRFLAFRNDKVVELWDIGSRKLVASMNSDEVSIWSFAFSPNNQILAAGREDGSLILWRLQDLINQNEILNITSAFSLHEHESAIHALSFSPNGQVLAVGSDDGKVTLWDVAMIDDYWNPDLRFMAIRNSKPVSEITAWISASPGTYGLAFSPNSKTLVSFGCNEKVPGIPMCTQEEIKLWRVRPSQPNEKLFTVTLAIVSTFTKSGKGIIAIDLMSDKVVILDTTTGQIRRTLLPISLDLVYDMELSPDGKNLALSRTSGIELILSNTSIEPNVDISQLDHITLVEEGAWEDIAFNTESNILASARCAQTSNEGGCQKSEVVFWDVFSGRRIGQPLELQSILGMAFNQTNNTITIITEEAIGYWNIETGQIVGSPTYLDDGYKLSGYVVISPDGSLFGTFEGFIIKIFDIKTGKPFGIPMFAPSGNVFSLAFSPDSKTLASGGRGGEVTLWDVASQQIETAFVEGYQFKGERCLLYASEFDSCGALGRGQDINDLIFTPDGKQLFSRSSLSMSIWDFDPLNWQILACQRASRNFSQEEWAQYFPGEEYRKTCPQWPTGE